MRFVAPAISDLRLQRIHRWILLWLQWFASFLTNAEAFAPFHAAATKEARRWLDHIERYLVAILILRAMPHLRLHRPARHSAYRRNESQMRRAIVGSALRRRLRARDLRARIEALSQDIGALVVRMVRRLWRGLTRRRPIKPRPETRRADLHSVFLAPTACADTS